MIASSPGSAATLLVATSWRQRGLRALAIALSALALCWPALWNGYPLLYPDSLEYLGAGHGVTMMLRGIATPAWMFRCMRSEIYAASLFLLHGRGPLWVIIVVQAAVTAWAIWLTVRSLCRRPVTLYLAWMLLLSLCTGVAWNASSVMPDILGPVLYLGLYLLVFAWDSLERWESVALGGVACWAAAAHTTHLLLAALLGMLFALLWLMGWPAMLGRGWGLVRVAGIVLLVAGLQMLAHARLYGRASLFGNPPPFLMARLLGDGPARLYLQEHCGRLTWTICAHVDGLPATESDFLWAPEGIWNTATQAERESLRAEELPLLKATLRTYPLRQAVRSGLNFVTLFATVGPWDFWNYGIFTPHNLEFAQEGLNAHYRRTRQARDAMPQRLARSLQWPVIAMCMVLTVALLPWLRRRADVRLLGLAATVLAVVVLNALLCGVISCNDPRLQDRVAWMVALLAGLMVSVWLRERDQVIALRKG